MKQRILVVGQTPPPFGGQNVMVQIMLDGRFRNVELCHLRMAFSKNLNDSGKFRATKFLELAKIVLGIYFFRIFKRANILYYPPAGPTMFPILKDIAILAPTRWLFAKTIFHFHSGGMAAFYERLPRLLRSLYKLAYFHPDAVIRTTVLAPEIAGPIRARKEFIVPNGIEDAAKDFEGKAKRPREALNLLYVGLISESKGIEILLEALRILRRKDVKVHLHLVGEVESPAFGDKITRFISESCLREHVTFHGVKTGTDKWDLFFDTDIFCFPTHFPMETFSVSLIEALCFGLPIVATRWRGSPDIVEDGTCGLLVPTKDPEAFAAAIERLALDPALRGRMALESRQRYLRLFSVERYQRNLEKVFDFVACKRAPRQGAGMSDG